MSENLKIYPNVDTVAEAYGLAKITDNHGNNVSGFYLSCKSSGLHILNIAQWVELNHLIEDAFDRGSKISNGVVDLGSLPSPLESECKNLGHYSNKITR